MQTWYSVLGYRIDLYFHKYKLAIEVDELGHADRNLCEFYIKSLSKLEVFKMDCQENIANNIKHKNHTIKNKTETKLEKNLAQRIVKNVKTFLIILDLKR